MFHTVKYIDRSKMYFDVLIIWDIEAYLLYIEG